MPTSLRNAVLPVALAAFAPAVLAQLYPPSDPRSPDFNRYQSEQNQRRQEQERQDQIRREQDEDDERRRKRRNAESPPPSLDMSQTSKALMDLRAQLLKRPPLPPEKNVLLGRWQLQKSHATNPNSIAGKLAMVQNPCAMLLGDEPIEFSPKSWASGSGKQLDPLGPAEYRADGKRFYVLPAQGVTLLAFEVLDDNRIKEMLAGGDCLLVRLGASKTATPPSASTPPAQPPTNTASAPPTPDACRNMMLAKLGQAREVEVRHAIAARGARTVDGKVPNSPNLRIDARGSPCDDRRLNAILYDFNDAGTLRSITLVWDRPAGAAPAPIFTERAQMLARLFNAPPPQSPSRLQVDTPDNRRIMLEDMAQRNLLLEAYIAR
jgi:hypothetical protein